MKVRHRDGRAHFSLLRNFDQSAAHYKTACEAKEEAPTPAMLLGTCTHHQLFGPRPGSMLVPWPGKTRSSSAVVDGVKWNYKAFAKEYTKLAKSKKLELTIVSATMWERAKLIADAVRADPVAGPLLFAEGTKHEVPLQWTDYGTGIECATSGVDALNVGKAYACDFKTTTNAEPVHFGMHAWDLRYHVQAAMTRSACETLGHPVRELYCVAAEVDPPHAVTVFRYAPPLIPTPGWDELDAIERGQRHMRNWLEQLKQCEQTGIFPAYQLAPVDWAIPDRILARLTAPSFEAENAA
jgi:PDDEXK-like domain of unknown function (DUF3799)